MDVVEAEGGVLSTTRPVPPPLRKLLVGTDSQLPAREPDSIMRCFCRPLVAGAPDASSHAAAKSGGGGLMSILGKATGIRTAIQKSVM